MPASQTTSRRLSREEVADAALELVIREGRSGLTMRKLAAELGVGTMTLYGHFRTKDELLGAAVDRASEDIRIPPRRGPWRRQLEELMLEIYRILRRYPEALELRARGPLQSPGVLRSTNAGLEILASAGLGKRARAQAWRLLFTYVFGYAAFTPAEVGPEDERRVRAALGALPEEGYDRLVESVPEAVAAMGGEETFRTGLRVILDGLEAGASRSTKRRA